ncbi:MAG: translation initiation factor IF-2 N-terminal domain-containing protein, partial [Clostridia bacterium]|nr:translation initiation factor IF-2 N-terminal domain-containing protein [Clostridia bacterium]
MINNTKYKISTLAKDLNIKSKDLLDLVTSLGMVDRKHSSVIESDEFNIILEALTSKAQVANFDDYMAGKATIVKTLSKEELEAIAKEREEKEAEEKRIAEEAAKKAAEEKARAEAEAKAKAEAEAKKKAEEEAKKNIKRPDSRQGKDNSRFDNKPDFSKTKNAPKEEKKKPTQQQTPFRSSGNDEPSGTVIKDHKESHVGMTRVVDTRATNVDLSKYD